MQFVAALVAAGPLLAMTNLLAVHGHGGWDGFIHHQRSVKLELKRNGEI
jgi:hypothetical protein